MRYWKRVGIIVASVGLFASSVAQGRELYVVIL